MKVEKNTPSVKVGFLKENLYIGGTERSAANISKLIENSFELYFILFNGSDIQYSYGGQLIDIKSPPKNSLLGKIVNSFIRYFKVKKELKRHKINLLYEFISIENLLSYATYKNVKRIVSARDFGKMQRKSLKYKKALSKANAMICNSEFIRTYYLSKYPEHTDKVFTVYNIIDNKEIACQAVEKIEKEYLNFINGHSNIVCVVGRFCKEKGFEFMLEAFASAVKNIDLGLVLIGDGEYRKKYDEIIKQHHLQDYVYFTGFQSNPYKYMAKCDIFVLSSLSEGFPNVLAEAMSLGLPVIAANCYSGPAEILRNDSDYNAVTDSFLECDYGIITPRITETDNENAISALTDALVYLSNNDKLMKKYSELSKCRATEFSPKAAAEKFDTIFEKLCNGSKK